MAVCIDTYCSLSGDPSIALIEDHRAWHLGVSTIGDYRYKPTVSYEEALALGRENERNSVSPSQVNRTEHEHHSKRTAYVKCQHSHKETEKPTFDCPAVSSTVPMVAKGDSLNGTSLIDP
ncbi:hypothetical protein BDV96DRAFT_603872 [Lophiotrema nucula]|uniref:Uncharacterized protein n=1 Tax=Lophiotrema nucula TaxID=690887 RepID=A0A6A5YTC3_9PLEO|nr:hypothetical protein BDV96DRAFT_603872 [Lophiotrema nucula]